MDSILKKNEPIFEWDEEQKIASCILYDKIGNKVFCGIAQAHPDDWDMANEMTGYNIAYTRAKIQALQDYRKNELKPGLAALKQLYYSMNRSAEFNEKSYEVRMLKRQINIKKADIETITEMISEEKKNLYNYINDKDDFYKQIRANRGKND